MSKYKSVDEIAAIFGVTPMGVRYWIRKGLKTKTVKIIGRKPRKEINVEDVVTFLGLPKNSIRKRTA